MGALLLCAATQPARAQQQSAALEYVPEPEVEAAAETAYDTGCPYSETRYEASPLDRPVRTELPADAAANCGSVFRETAYGVAPGGLAYTLSVDEVGDAAKSFTDGFGRQVKTTGDPGGISATTRFSYDLLGNLTRVVQPEGEERTYRYSARSLLVAKATPEADGDGDGDPTSEEASSGGGTPDARYAYDAAGDLRFRQGPAEREEGAVFFQRYDGLGRPTASGVAALPSGTGFGGLNALQAEDYPFESDRANWRTVRAYDAAPSAETAPWSSYDWQGAGVQVDSAKGRLAATARRVSGGAGGATANLAVSGSESGTRTYEAAGTLTATSFTAEAGADVTMRAGEKVLLGAGFSVEAGAVFHAETDPALKEGGDTPEQWRLTFRSYGREGRLKQRWVFSPGAPRLVLSYRRDRQGRLLRRRATLEGGAGGGASSFCWWYAYNARGLVEAVYAAEGCAPGAGRPSAPEVTFAYNAAGQVENTSYRGATQIARTYHVRGWLASVGQLDGSGGPFGAGYDYYADGTLERERFRQEHPGLPGGTKAYAYTYDALDRLKSADYAGDGTGGAYDVSSLTYDASGNISGLERRGAEGALVDDLGYTYDAGSGRLASVSDAAGAAYDWDADAGSLSYDRAGRLTSAPAPYEIADASYDERSLPQWHVLGSGASADTIRYRYSMGGERTYRRVGTGVQRHYLLGEGGANLGTLVGENLQHWNLTLPSGSAFGRASGDDGSRRYYLKGRLGSPRAIVDAGGSPKAARDYYPFGLRMPGRSATSGTPTEEDFTGHERDGETQLLYAGARYYMSALGRWTSPDPLAEKYPSHSSYNYALNNPVNAVDPDGRLVIFVNGFRPPKEKRKPWTWGNRVAGGRSYWRPFNKNIMGMMPDGENAEYYDGSSRYWSTSIQRHAAGRSAASNDFGSIISTLRAEREAGLSGTLKVFSHSQGGAFANGLISGLISEATDRGVDELKIAFHAAIEPAQAAGAGFEEHPGVQTFQIQSLNSILANSRLAGSNLIPGSEVGKVDNPGHSISDYSAPQILDRIQRETGFQSSRLNSFILRAARAGAQVSIVE